MARWDLHRWPSCWEPTFDSTTSVDYSVVRLVSFFLDDNGQYSTRIHVVFFSGKLSDRCARWGRHRGGHLFGLTVRVLVTRREGGVVLASAVADLRLCLRAHEARVDVEPKRSGNVEWAVPVAVALRPLQGLGFGLLASYVAKSTSAYPQRHVHFPARLRQLSLSLRSAAQLHAVPWLPCRALLQQHALEARILLPCPALRQQHAIGDRWQLSCLALLQRRAHGARGLPRHNPFLVSRRVAM